MDNDRMLTESEFNELAIFIISPCANLLSPEFERFLTFISVGDNWKTKSKVEFDA